MSERHGQVCGHQNAEELADCRWERQARVRADVGVCFVGDEGWPRLWFENCSDAGRA